MIIECYYNNSVQIMNHSTPLKLSFTVGSMENGPILFLIFDKLVFLLFTVSIGLGVAPGSLFQQYNRLCFHLLKKQYLTSLFIGTV